MKIIITRHGETEENKQGIIQGQLPGKLSDLGIEQAKKLAERLKDEQIDAIFSSDLARAADTAKEIINFHSSIPAEFIEELRERNLGKLQGLRKEEDLGIPKGRMLADYINVAEGGESSEELLQRAGNFISNLLENYSDKIVLLVGHNGINKAIIANLLNKNSDELKSIQPQENTAVTIFELNQNKEWQLVLMNCTKHLE